MKLPFKRDDRLEKLEVEDLTVEGMGVVRVDRAVLFIPGAVPGDVIDVRVRKTRKNYGEGEITGILTPSRFRTAPRCSHFGTCGGCKMQPIQALKILMCRLDFYLALLLGWLITSL